MLFLQSVFMAFLNRFTLDYDASVDSVIHSVSEEIATIFSNRNDRYWAYNFESNELIPVHEVFKLNFFSNEFKEQLSIAIEAFEPRIKNVSVAVDHGSFTEARIVINGKILHNNELISLSDLFFDLNN